MTAATSHRLEGLEPDNLLAFLALVGLLRSLEADDRKRAGSDALRPRAAWDVDMPPLRPRLFLSRELKAAEVAEHAADGLQALAAAHEFDGRRDPDYSRHEARALLKRDAKAGGHGARDRADLLAALMSDAATKEDKKGAVDPTPLCLLHGQGHQHFLERLVSVPRLASPPRGGGKKKVFVSAPECLAEALFRPWHREDPTFSFRWDPEEDVRYALMAGDPTDPAYKPGTQHGANRLAAVGLGVLTLAPRERRGRVRPSVIGGHFGPNGFSFAWPIWRHPATLSAVRAMLSHPQLRDPSALRHLSVDHVMVARRVSVGKFANFSRARPPE